MKTGKPVQITGSQHEQLFRVYGQDNESTLSNTCINFNKESKLCKNCFYFSSYKQERECGRICEFWESVFGSGLQKQLISLMEQGIKVGSKFMDVWHARKVAVPVINPHQFVSRRVKVVEEPIERSRVSVVNFSVGSGHKKAEEVSNNMGTTISVVEI
jgi:hypothetical protein